MNDADLAAFLNIDVALVPRLSPADRLRYEAMAPIYDQIQAWDRGEPVPLPPGVIVCRVGGTKKRKRHR